MKLGASLSGDLKQMMAEEVGKIERANTAAMRRSAGQVQRDYRKQVRAAGLGQGVEKAWRKADYPKGRKRTMSPAALVYTKASTVIDAMSQSRTIKSSRGHHLVIPLPAAKARGWDRSVEKSKSGQPRRWADLKAAKAALGKLRMVMIGGRRALLVGPRKAGEARPTAYFLLVPQARTRKVLDLDGPPRKAIDRLPQVIIREIEKQDARSARR